MMKKYFPLLLSAFLYAGCAQPSGTLPKPDHIVVVIEENHGFGEIIGSSLAPYINQLGAEGALFTNAHGVVHPSQPNYIALYSGELQGVTDDHCLLPETPDQTPNLGASLIQAGLSFKGYAETMPYGGFPGCSYMRSTLTGGYLYARKHAPWVNWIGTGENNYSDSISLPMSEFPHDFNQLPTVCFVIPNQDNDMHNNGGDSLIIKKADDWLKDHISAYAEWAKTHNSLLIVTYDEDNFTPQNHIPTLFVGEMVRPGQYADSINHYNVLRTIEAMYGLPPAGPAQEKPIATVWQ